MSGIRLLEMESSEMLDVLHYLFEEDLHVSSAEEVQSISKTRTVIYKSLYNKDYKYAVSVSNGGESGGAYASGEYFDEDVFPEDSPLGEESELTPFDPDIEPMKSHKKYVPPTDFNPESSRPFGTTLDTPLN